jgi:hypothetical protein
MPPVLRYGNQSRYEYTGAVGFTPTLNHGPQTLTIRLPVLDHGLLSIEAKARLYYVAL